MCSRFYESDEELPAATKKEIGRYSFAFYTRAHGGRLWNFFFVNFYLENSMSFFPQPKAFITARTNQLEGEKNQLIECYRSFVSDSNCSTTFHVRIVLIVSSLFITAM